MNLGDEKYSESKCRRVWLIDCIKSLFGLFWFSQYLSLSLNSPGTQDICDMYYLAVLTALKIVERQNMLFRVPHLIWKYEVNVNTIGIVKLVNIFWIKFWILHYRIFPGKKTKVMVVSALRISLSRRCRSLLLLCDLYEGKGQALGLWCFQLPEPDSWGSMTVHPLWFLQVTPLSKGAARAARQALGCSEHHCLAFSCGSGEAHLLHSSPFSWHCVQERQEVREVIKCAGLAIGLSWPV